MHEQNEDGFVHQLLKQFHENLDTFNEDKNNRKRTLYRKIEFSYSVTLHSDGSSFISILNNSFAAERNI